MVAHLREKLSSSDNILPRNDRLSVPIIPHTSERKAKINQHHSEHRTYAEFLNYLPQNFLCKLRHFFWSLLSHILWPLGASCTEQLLSLAWQERIPFTSFISTFLSSVVKRDVASMFLYAAHGKNLYTLSSLHRKNFQRTEPMSLNYEYLVSTGIQGRHQVNVKLPVSKATLSWEHFILRVSITIVH